MPLNEVNLGAIKERPEVMQSTSSPGLTDSLELTKERLMSNHIIPSSQAYIPTDKELGLLRRRMTARGWSYESVQLIVRHCQQGTDPVFARFLIDHWVYRKGR
jgi:hypothetical protein